MKKLIFSIAAFLAISSSTFLQSMEQVSKGIDFVLANQRKINAGAGVFGAACGLAGAVPFTLAFTHNYLPQVPVVSKLITVSASFLLAYYACEAAQYCAEKVKNTAAQHATLAPYQTAPRYTFGIGGGILAVGTGLAAGYAGGNMASYLFLKAANVIASQIREMQQASNALAH